MTDALSPAGRGGATFGAVPESRTVDAERGWIHSRNYDLALFTLSPLAGLFLLWANSSLPGGVYIVAAATYFIAIPHYLSSFSFFLGDENLSNYRSRRLAFFGGPVVIVLAVIILRGLGHHAPVQSAMYVWNIYHVSLQSAGILSLYRRLNGGPLAERPVAHVAILATNATMAFWNLDRFPPLYDSLAALHPYAPWALRAICLIIAVGALAVLFYRIARRIHPMSFPEASFLGSSLLLFHPYLWVADSNLATFGMLMGHFIQYLAVVWLLNRRKYAGAGGSWHQRTLAAVSGSPVLLGSTILGAGLTFYALQKGAALIGMPMLYVMGWNALTLVHFYLDGLIWAFKKPFVRQSIGPYLTPASHFAAPVGSS